MKLLIDCSIDYVEISLLKNDKLISSTYEKLQKNLTKILVPTIENVLKINNIKKEDISSIYVINGPGSFTSIKLASIFANTWKQVYKNVSLFQLNTCLWHTIKSKTFSYLDAKSKLWYLNIIDENNKTIFLNIVDDIKFQQIKSEYLNKKFNIVDCGSSKLTVEQKWNFNKNHFVCVNKIIPYYLKDAVQKN